MCVCGGEADNNNVINYGTIIFVLFELLRGEFLFVNVLNTDFESKIAWINIFIRELLYQKQ